MKETPEYFTKHSDNPQDPDFLFITCSDSRVPPNLITNFGLGELFVHRNVANVITAEDSSINALLEFSVTALNIKHIVLCGHYGCAGVRVALEKAMSEPETIEPTSPIDAWLNNIKQVYNANKEQFAHVPSLEEKAKLLVQLNVKQGCSVIAANEFVKKAQTEKGFPSIKGMVYDMREGLLQEIDLN